MGSDMGVRIGKHAPRAAGRRLPIVLAGALALGASPASTAAAGGAHGQPAGHRGHRRACTWDAHAAARALLRRLMLPVGADPDGSASEATSQLTGPISQPAAPALVDVHRYWHLPEAPDTATRWLVGHPPALATIRGGGLPAEVPSGQGAGDTDGASGVWWVRFAFAPAHRCLASEELVLALTRASDGGSLLRADAQVSLVLHRGGARVTHARPG